MFCKTIILSNSQNVHSNAPKGILTLSNQNNTTIGKIRLYNILSLPPNTKIGLYINEQVYISTLNKRPQHYEFDLDKNINLNNSIYCALIDNSMGDKQVILEGGSFNGFYFTDSPFDAVLESKDEELEQTIDSAMKSLDDCPCDKNCGDCEYKKYFYDNYENHMSHIDNLNNTSDNEVIEDISLQDTIKSIDDTNINDTEQVTLNNDIIESLIEDDNVSNLPNNKVADINTPVEKPSLNTDALNKFEDISIDGNHQSQESMDTFIENSKATDTFNYNAEHLNNMEEVNATYLKKEQNSSLDNNKNGEPQSNDLDDEQNQFLNDIIYQLDEMFVKYPADEVLNSIIPNSRFIRVEGDSAKPYVLGVIYENKLMKYISYGVPAEYNSLPPADLGQNYQWLPLNPEDVMSDGYYLIYQNALTGKIVDLTIE